MARTRKTRDKYKGMTKRELLAMLRSRNTHKGRKPRKRKSRKHMAKNRIPPELRVLAEALREFSKESSPSKAKYTAAERKAAALLRQIRAAKKREEAAAKKKAEDEEFMEKAKSWVGSAGDPGGRRRRRRKARKGTKRKRRTNSWTSYVKKHAGSRKYKGKSARARMRALSADYKRSGGGKRRSKRRSRRDYGWSE